MKDLSVDEPGAVRSGRSGRRFLLLISLTLLGAALVAAPASAGVGGFRLGVVGQLADHADAGAMGRANVGTLRLFFRWSEIERQRRTGARCNAVYDWSAHDRIVRRASRRKVRVLPTILGSPAYAASHPNRPPHTSSPAVEDLTCFVRALVRRYGRGGRFVRQNARVLPITAWQIWNEPNLAQFAANGQPNPREYARLVTVSRREILARDRRASIILAGMPEASRGVAFKTFLTQLYRVRGFRKRFDAVAMHPYARTHKGIEGALVRLRRVLRGVGDRRRPVWITETGWASHGRGFPFLRKTERDQATQLRKSFRMMRKNRKRFRIGTVTWFRWQDVASYSQNAGAFSYTGLFRLNGTPKPACRAYVSFTGGRCVRISPGS